jgi:hypothetical protein
MISPFPLQGFHFVTLFVSNPQTALWLLKNEEKAKELFLPANKKTPPK